VVTQKIRNKAQITDRINSMNIIKLIILSLSTVILVSISAIAEDRKINPGWSVTIGTGGVYAPAFLGSNSYQLSVFPELSIKYKNHFFASMKDGIGYNIINSSGWQIGPVAKYVFERKENGDNPFRVIGPKSNALRGLGDVDGTVELGGFVKYILEPFTYKIELRQGVNGHKGMIGETSISYGGTITQFGPPIIYSFGPRATVASSDYNNAYFGINQTQSARSGLDRYNADSGIVSYGIGGFALFPFTDSISFSMFAGYNSLSNEVSNSPLVVQLGSENQFVSGLSISYKFDY
jgi:outer membrane protein